MGRSGTGPRRRPRGPNNRGPRQRLTSSPGNGGGRLAAVEPGQLGRRMRKRAIQTAAAAAAAAAERGSAAPYRCLGLAPTTGHPSPSRGRRGASRAPAPSFAADTQPQTISGEDVWVHGQRQPQRDAPVHHHCRGARDARPAAARRGPAARGGRQQLAILVGVSCAWGVPRSRATLCARGAARPRSRQAAGRGRPRAVNFQIHAAGGAPALSTSGRHGCSDSSSL